jgi:hypothetical protein
VPRRSTKSSVGDAKIRDDDDDDDDEYMMKHQVKQEEADPL